MNVPSPPAPPSTAQRPAPPSAWWLVLFLVGVDYFSTLAYVPSLAVRLAGAAAPLAVALVVAVTLLLVVPVYAYVLGRSPEGQGATGLLRQTLHGWGGKLLILLLMGFVATDFVITRTLSIADASIHLLANPHWQQPIEQLAPDARALHDWFGPDVGRALEPFWHRQVGVTLGLSIVTFFAWLFLQRGFTPNLLRLTAVVVGVYLVMTGVVIGSGLLDLARQPERLEAWWQKLVEVPPDVEPAAVYWGLARMCLWAFPVLALGISGFELSMSLTPLVRGRPGTTGDLVSRVRKTRLMLVTAAVLMGVYLLGAALVATLQVPADTLGEGGTAEYRTLAYLAHGGYLADGRPATDLCPWFGDVFGSVYDVSTVVILCLAGISVMIGLRDLVPVYLHRMGMEPEWATRFGLMMHLFNVIILVVTLVFHASVTAQQSAYSTSVLVLLAGAAFAAQVDLYQRWRGSWLRPVVTLLAALVWLFFVGMAGLSVAHHGSGLVIALLFVGAIVGTSIWSRWERSLELRFEGFTFPDAATEERWNQIRDLDFQVLVPHRPGHVTLLEKDQDIRHKHRIGPDVPIIYIEAEVGDPSEFYQKPLMTIEKVDGLEVIRVNGCVSVAHVIAAIGLEFRHVGRPPEIIFGWSRESPFAANLNFLLLGQGNVPWLVQELVWRTEPDHAKQPRIVIG